jgi:amino acid transporter
MSVAILLLLLSTLSTGIFVGGRILVAMASRGELPAALGRRRGNGAPTAAILLQGVITLIFLWSAGLSALLQYIGLLTIICASMSSFAVIIYRRRGVPRPWSMPLYPVPVVIALGLTGWAVYSSIVDQPWPAVASIATMVVVVLARPLLIRRTGSTIGADGAESVDTAPRDRTS